MSCFESASVLIIGAIYNYASRLEAKLDQIMTITPCHAAGVELKNIVRKWRRSFFVFMTNRAIPPTNNGSERALRLCVTFRKITNGFRPPWGAKLYADVRSVIETARRCGISALDAIRNALNGTPVQTAVA